MYEIDPSKASSWIAQLIAYDSLPATIDFVKNLIIIQSQDQKDEVQTLLANYGEKLSMLVESNEKHWEAKSAALKIGNSVNLKQKSRKVA